MSTTEEILAADAAAGSLKRKVEVGDVAHDEPEAKKAFVSPLATTLDDEEPFDNSKKGREIRLEQNRKAARESRRRKKVMIEELQRSVIFFSRANGTLKQQNDELTRLLIQAQAQVKAASSDTEEGTVAVASTSAISETPQAAASPQVGKMLQQVKNESFAANQEQQVKAQAVAAQALYEAQGFPAAAARAAAQTMNVPPMQPGATMQAMANFQQAAAAAMQAAMQGMHGVSLQQMTAVAPGAANAAQAYTDTMTALAMQQAAAAHIGQQFLQTAFIANPIAWSPAKAQPVQEAEVTTNTV
jgi:bZIP transcription factor